ncbi:MAG: hypothetical protein ACRD18_16300 [Terriglobia bacterium]
MYKLLRIVLNAGVAVCILGLAAPPAAAAQMAAAPVDRTAIRMTAQDGTGAVWATAGPAQADGLYRWQGDHWVLAHAQTPGGVPVGIWNGLDGGVVVVWEGIPGVPPGAALTWYRGDQYKLLGKLEGGLGGLHVFSTPPANFWITANTPNIYRLAPDGLMHVVYTFNPGQFYTYHRYPGRAVIYCPLDVTVDGQGRTWFWSNASGEYINAAAAQGFVIYDGHSFAYHRSIEGLPVRGLSFLGRVDGTHLWAATLGDGMYSINTETMAAERIPEPEPDAFERVTKVFRDGSDIYLVNDPHARAVAETPAHRLASVLWRFRKGKWEKVLTGIDDLPEPAEGLSRPWLAAKKGLWLGANASGMWFIPSNGKPPRLIDWHEGFPLDTVNALYSLSVGESAGATWMLAVDRSPSRAAAFRPESLRAPAKVNASVKVINPYTVLQPDQQFRMWTVLSLSGRALDEWDGVKWVAHPLPGNVSPTWLSGLDADSQGRIWLFPDCRQGPIAIFDPYQGSWANYSSYQTALEEQHGVHIRFINAADDRMKPIYGPGPQIAFTGACRGINYFDGTSWRIWNRQDVPGDPHYFFDGPAFFDSAGHLAVNIHHETWEIAPGTGWHLITYEAGKARPVRWFTPNPPGQAPAGCALSHSTSFSRDRLGRSWWTWEGNVYAGVPGVCRAVLNAGERQPFIDGRRLRRVLVDLRGNVFFETLIASHRVGEYVIYSPPETPPHPALRVTRLSPDSIRLNFSATPLGNALYSWRVDEGSWSAPQSQDSAVLRQLPGGEHRIEAEAIGSRLQVDPVPASATVEINVKPGQQMAGLLAQLANATGDDQREAAIESIERQPPVVSLPALRAARVHANDTERWWIDAAIQAIGQKQSP